MTARAAPHPRARHVPMRRCLACRLSRPQAELVRLVLREGEWQLDPSRKLPGRGAWLCRDKPGCHSAKALKRSLRGQAERVAHDLETYFAAPPQAAREEDAPAPQPVSKRAPTSGRVRARATKNGKPANGKTGNSKTGNGGPNV